MPIYTTGDSQGQMLYGVCDSCGAESSFVFALYQFKRWAAKNGWAVTAGDGEYYCLCGVCQNKERRCGNEEHSIQSN